MKCITSTKNEASAKRTKRFIESRGIPCVIRQNKSTYVLFTTSDEYLRQAKQLRLS